MDKYEGLEMEVHRFGQKNVIETSGDDMGEELNASKEPRDRKNSRVQLLDPLGEARAR